MNNCTHQNCSLYALCPLADQERPALCRPCSAVALTLGLGKLARCAVALALAEFSRCSAKCLTARGFSLTSSTLHVHSSTFRRCSALYSSGNQHTIVSSSHVRVWSKETMNPGS